MARANIASGGGGIQIESYGRVLPQPVRVEQRPAAAVPSKEPCPECGNRIGCRCPTGSTMGKVKCDEKWGEGGAVPAISQPSAIPIRARPMTGSEMAGIGNPSMRRPLTNRVSLGQGGIFKTVPMEEVTTLLRSLEKALADVAAASDRPNAPNCVRDIMAGSYLLAKKSAETLRAYVIAGVPRFGQILTDGEAATAAEVMKCAANLPPAYFQALPGSQSSGASVSDMSWTVPVIAVGIGALVIVFLV